MCQLNGVVQVAVGGEHKILVEALEFLGLEIEAIQNLLENILKI